MNWDLIIEYAMNVAPYIIIPLVILFIISIGMESSGPIGDIFNIIWWIIRHLWKLFLIMGIAAIVLSTWNSLS